MKSTRKPFFAYLHAFGAGVVIVGLVCGCASRRDSDDGEFAYEEPEAQPFVEPEIALANRYLPMTPSGMLKGLAVERIAVVDEKGYQGGADAAGYLKSQARRSKEEGKSFLPYHYYVSPEGGVYEGQNDNYQGYLGSNLNKDSLLVAVLGDYDDPADFMPEAQEASLIQLLAWLCAEHSVSSRQVVPGHQVDPAAERLGTNLDNWFGPTQTLQREVERTLQSGKERDSKKKKKKSWRPPSPKDPLDVGSAYE